MVQLIVLSKDMKRCHSAIAKRVSRCNRNDDNYDETDGVQNNRGVDAPEGRMPYGPEARQALVKLIQGKCLKIHVYQEDQFGRLVGDVYCDEILIQEQLLKRGSVWHFVAYDRRPEFAMWEKEARAGHRGLWALPDPEKPWVWRKNNRNPHEH